MVRFLISGMKCIACTAHIEKTVSKVEGVTNCTVSLLTNSMDVEGTATSEAIIKAVSNVGYVARLKEPNNVYITDEIPIEKENIDVFDDTETPKLRKRLLASIIILLPLLYISMGHMLWNFPLPSIINDNFIIIGISEMILTIIIICINREFFISGFKGLIHRVPNMDTLVALGASAAFCYSVYNFFVMIKALSNGDNILALKYMNSLYFESAATILTLITVGKMLESKAKGKTTDALKALIKMTPQTAVVFRNNEEITISIKELKKGEKFVVYPGETVPVDGEIIEGTSSINESILTGESIPVDKKVGDLVSAATINQSGYLICEATRVGEDTTFSQIIQMISDASMSKAPIAKIADKVSGIFVPTVIIIAFITLIIWLIVGQTVEFALSRAISVLVISCPCALGLATPVAIMVANGRSAKHGILFKSALSLEETGRVQIVALDKTGTITKGEPEVTNIIPAVGITDRELLTYAYSLENKSEHPLAKAIVKKAEKEGVDAFAIENFKNNPGNGLECDLIDKNKKNKIKLLGGKFEYLASKIDIPEEMKIEANKESKLGRTPLYFVKDNIFLGIISVSDIIREDSAVAIKKLKNLGIKVVMLTGDNENTAGYIGKIAGIDEVISNILPDEKKSIIEHMQENAKIAMVGDGINDAPALTQADVGVAIGAGSDIAIDAANVVLIKNTLRELVLAIQISRCTLRNIKQNLFWAFIYNVVGIPLAAGVFIPIFGWTLNPIFGAAAMGLSSFCVVSNALRLNFIKFDDRKEMLENMEINVNGMMCEHCEAHVKKALESIEGVVEAIPNHNTNTVKIFSEKVVDVEKIKSAIIDAGYEFAGEQI